MMHFTPLAMLSTLEFSARWHLIWLPEGLQELKSYQWWQTLWEALLIQSKYQSHRKIQRTTSLSSSSSSITIHHFTVSSRCLMHAMAAQPTTSPPHSGWNSDFCFFFLYSIFFMGCKRIHCSIQLRLFT